MCRCGRGGSDDEDGFRGSSGKGAMRTRDLRWAKWTNGKRKKAIRTCRCIISFAIDGIGAADGACVGDGPVGEGGTTVRSSISGVDGRGEHR